jgi:hypothetical protein
MTGQSQLKRILSWLVIFPLPVIAYVALWRFAGVMALDRLGYNLWLKMGPDYASYAEILPTFFRWIVPVLLGVTGLGWCVIRWRVENRK